MGDQISLLSFYLGLVTLLCATFFARLDGWYAEVQAIVKQWDFLQKRHKNLLTPDADYLREFRLRALSLREAVPLKGFVLVSGFIILLCIMSSILGFTITNETFSVEWFIYFPGAIFVLAFFGASGWYLYQGSCRLLPQLLKEIDNV